MTEQKTFTPKELWNCISQGAGKGCPKSMLQEFTKKNFHIDALEKLEDTRSAYYGMIIGKYGTTEGNIVIPQAVECCPCGFECLETGTCCI